MSPPAADAQHGAPRFPPRCGAPRGAKWCGGSCGNGGGCGKPPRPAGARCSCPCSGSCLSAAMAPVEAPSCSGRCSTPSATGRAGGGRCPTPRSGANAARCGAAGPAVGAAGGPPLPTPPRCCSEAGGGDTTGPCAWAGRCSPTLCTRTWMPATLADGAALTALEAPCAGAVAGKAAERGIDNEAPANAFSTRGRDAWFCCDCGCGHSFISWCGC
mmetsp:Transcript_49430/g.159546  ORF Transcript_49430/g.159546 Transcript_49430/m.159546 type:complete len:215 (-) Transcript_49430:122-766(-)